MKVDSKDLRECRLAIRLAKANVTFLKDKLKSHGNLHPELEVDLNKYISRYQKLEYLIKTKYKV